MNNKKTISLSFILSVLVHVVIAAVLVLQSNDSLKRLTESKKTVEVELIDAEKFLAETKKSHKPVQVPSAQIVQQEDRVNDETPEDSRFLSKHNQKVLTQTQAALNGKYKNSEESSGEKKSQKVLGKTEKTAEAPETKTARAEKSEPVEKDFLTSEDGFVSSGKKPSLKDLTPSFRPSAPHVNAQEIARGGGEGPSATDDHLKDVKTGMQTVLSTREFMYYSYYARIRSKLGQYWQPKIREKMERIMKQGRTIASEGDKITRIIIVLDENGVLQKVQVLGSAGVTDLDDAAVEAFRAAAPFPNPPKGMVEADGTIKIRWDFILEA